MSADAHLLVRRVPAPAPAVAPYFLAAAFAVAMIGGTLPAPLYPLWAPELGFGPLTTTLIFAAYAVGTIAALLALGGLSDEAGRRPLLGASLALTALAGILFAVADSVAVLVVARVVSGVAVGIMTATATAALTELDAPAGRRAPRLATLANMGGLGLGAVLAGTIGSALDNPTRDVFLVHLVAVALCAALLLALPETVAERSWPRLAVRRPAAPPAAHRPAFVRGCAVAFAAFALLGLFSSLVPSFLRGELGEAGLAVAGVTVGSVFLVAAVTQLLVPPERTEGGRRAAPGVMMAGFAVVEAGLLVGELAVFAAGAAVAGVGVGLALKGSIALVQRISSPEHRAGLNATFFLAAYGGLTVPAIALGALSQRVAPATAAPVVATAVAGALGAVVWMAERARV